MSEILVAPCSYQAAKYACENWHYSKSLPAGRLIKHGIWENDKFIGVILYGTGACPEYGTKFKLKQGEVCELVRIAMKDHICFVTQVLSKSIKKLKQESKMMRLIVSYADLEQNHEGKIYQASNWIFVGTGGRHSFFIILGKKIHNRNRYEKYKGKTMQWIIENIDKDAKEVKQKDKLKYLMPLDKAMRRQIEPLAKPYLKNLAEVD